MPGIITICFSTRTLIVVCRMRAGVQYRGGCRRAVGPRVGAGGGPHKCPPSLPAVRRAPTRRVLYFSHVLRHRFVFGPHDARRGLPHRPKIRSGGARSAANARGKSEAGPAASRDPPRAHASNINRHAHPASSQISEFRSCMHSVSWIHARIHARAGGWVPAYWSGSACRFGTEGAAGWELLEGHVYKSLREAQVVKWFVGQRVRLLRRCWSLPECDDVKQPPRLGKTNRVGVQPTPLTNYTIPRGTLSNAHATHPRSTLAILSSKQLHLGHESRVDHGIKR